MPTTEKQVVIKAIGDLGRKVTTADVATKTGLPVLVVQQKLNEVAADTGGHLKVSNAGDILYAFEPGFSNAYLANGIKAVLILIGAKILEVAFFLVRISFGIALVLSLVIGIILLVAIAIAMLVGMKGGRDDDRDGGGLGDFFDFGGGGFHFSFWDWMILRDIFFWNSYGYSGYEQPRYDYNKPTERPRPKSNFLLNCFSFLFGDGDPNEGLEEKKWQLVAQVIKKHNNVLTAEQLAPYTGANPKNEDGVLPVLVRFNGKPEVTDSGNLVYVFDSMHATAAEQRINPPPALQEFEWKFSTVPDGELMPVYIVAGLNIAIAWVVWNFFHHANRIAVAILHSAPFVPGLTTVLFAYGAVFIAVPVIRHIINQLRNKKIESRNLERYRYSQILAQPSPELAKKLSEARAYRVGDTKVKDEDIVYTTEKDALDQPDDLSDKFKGMEDNVIHFNPDATAGSTKGDSTEKPRKRSIDDVRKKLQDDFDASP